MVNFEQLRVYQKALDFASNIYHITRRWPQSELFGLTSQIRRAATSISLNIAEGNSRSAKDYAHFLLIAKGSCFECIPLLEIAKRTQLLNGASFTTYYLQLEELIKMVSALRKSIIVNPKTKNL